MGIPSSAALTVVRAGTALMFVIHGITIVEIAGGVALAAGLLVRPVALWFIVQLAAGIYLIHARAGWFVVGAGRNGAEFSALLIIRLAAAALSTPDSTNLQRRWSV